MSVFTYIFATPSLLNMTLALGFCLKHRDNMGMVIQQLCIGKNTSDTRKVLKARTNQHQVIAGSGGTPTMEDAAYLTVPNGFSLPETEEMARSAHKRLRVVLINLMVRGHPVAQGMDVVVRVLVDR